MKVFNEDGDLLGFFTEAAEDVFDNTKDTVYSLFEASLFLGIIGLFISPFWAILAIVGILLLKLISIILKFVFNCIWWIIKAPFCLLFWRELPEF